MRFSTLTPNTQHSDSDRRILDRRGVLILLGFCLVTATFALWQTQRARRADALATRTQTEARSHASEVETMFNQVHRGLEKLAASGGPSQRPRPDQWEADAAFYVDTFDGVESIAWVDDAFIVRAIVPAAGNQNRLNQPANQGASDRRSVNVWMACYNGTVFDGYILGTVSLGELLTPVLIEAGDAYVVQLLSEGETVFTSANGTKADGALTARRTLTLYDTAVVTMALTPTETAVRAEMQRADRTLTLGLVLSAVLVGSAFVAQNARTIAGLFAVRYHNLFEASKDAIFVLDAAGRFRDANPAALSLTGFSLQELEALTLTDLLVGPAGEGDPTPPMEIWRTDASSEVQVRRQDGQAIPIELMLSPVTTSAEQGYLLGIARDITERKNAERALRAALRRSESLVQELYHRTKNNMQVVIAMLRLQSATVDDSQLQRAFHNAENRIRAMSLVHDTLYRSDDLSIIRLDTYIRNLVDGVAAGYPTCKDRVSINFNLEPVTTLIDIAMPCGLIVNELLANALTHAFPNGRSGCISIGLRHHDDHEIVITFADNGVGMPKDWDPEGNGTFGFQAVSAIATDQLQGTLTRLETPGTGFELRFRDDLYWERV